jgi:uncharacterized protein (DUF1778 family)
VSEHGLKFNPIARSPYTNPAQVPALSFTVLPKAVEELGLIIETQEVKCLSVEDFEKLTEYLDNSEVRERLHRLSLRSKSNKC